MQSNHLLLTLSPTKLSLGPALGGQVLGQDGVDVSGKDRPPHQAVGLNVDGKWLGMVGKLDNPLLGAGKLLAKSELGLNLLVNDKVGTVGKASNIQLALLLVAAPALCLCCNLTAVIEQKDSTS